MPKASRSASASLAAAVEQLLQRLLSGSDGSGSSGQGSEGSSVLGPDGMARQSAPIVEAELATLRDAAHRYRVYDFRLAFMHASSCTDVYHLASPHYVVVLP